MTGTSLHYFIVYFLVASVVVFKLLNICAELHIVNSKHEFTHISVFAMDNTNPDF